MLDHFLHTRWSDVMGRMNCAIYGDVKSVEKHFAARIILAFARFIIIRTNVFWILNNFYGNETNAMHLKTEKNSGTEKKSESHRKLQFFYANLMSPASAVFLRSIRKSDCELIDSSAYYFMELFVCCGTFWVNFYCAL